MLAFLWQIWKKRIVFADDIALGMRFIPQLKKLQKRRYTQMNNKALAQAFCSVVVTSKPAKPKKKRKVIKMMFSFFF